MRIRSLLASLLVVTAACSSAPPVSRPSPRPTLASTPLETATPKPPGLPCRLPVLLAANRAGPLAGGFLSLPDGAVQADPSALMVVEGRRQHTSGPNPLYGDLNAPPSYDAVVGRWLPGPFSSPDGRRYVYAEDLGPDASHRFENTRLHVVDVAGGADVVLLNSGHLRVVGWTAAGILAFPATPGGPDPGLWLVDPATGAQKQLDTGHPREGWTAGLGAAWTSDGDRVLRLDLATAAEQPWFTKPGSVVWVMGFTADGSLVAVATEQGAAGMSHVLLIASAGAAPVELWAGKQSAFDGALGINQPVPDKFGTWFLGPPSPAGGDLFLYANGSLRKVASAAIAGVVGPCG